MAAPLPDEADFAALYDAWESSHADFAQLAHSLTDEEWSTPTALPGWTAGDIVAHVAWIEDMLGGHTDEPHEPDWASLPHATSDFGRFVEVPVDLRRSWSREQVLAELDAAIARRRAMLTEGERSADEPIVGLMGELPLGTHLRMRTFDAWVHEQDIRDAIDEPGHADSLGARATAAHLLPGLPKVWAKGAGAQPGEALALHVTGPVSFDRTVIVDDEGRAGVTSPDTPATTTIAMPWAAYVGLSCGRGDPAQWISQVTSIGDRRRADGVLAAMCVTP